MVEIYLGYFKQGDDLNSCLEATSNNVDAFHMHAKRLYDCAKHLDKIAEVLKSYPDAKMQVDANVHFITMDGSKEILDVLVEKELASVPEWDDEEEECEGEEIVDD